VSVANYLPEPDDSNTLRIVVKIYRKFNQLPDALRIALRLNDSELINEIFESCSDTYGIGSCNFVSLWYLYLLYLY
jgi:26S proteasome regulatory subunit N1